MKHLSWLVTLVVVLVVAEAALVALVLVDPDIARAVGNASSEVVEVWTGEDDHEGLAAIYGDAAGDFIGNWIEPLWAAPEPDSSDQEFVECLACHSDYAKRPRSGSIYIDHSGHSALGIGCGDCHSDTVHPKPLPPNEETCAACHSEVNTPGECQFCHAPGSLAHFEDMGVPRDGYVECTTCHVGALSSSGGTHLTSHSTFNGTEPATCSTCHEVDWCAECHAAEHGDDWINVHGQSAAYTGPKNCLACHSSNVCAGCHSGAQKRPLPIGGIER